MSVLERIWEGLMPSSEMTEKRVEGSAHASGQGEGESEARHVDRNSGLEDISIEPGPERLHSAHRCVSKVDMGLLHGPVDMKARASSDEPI